MAIKPVDNESFYREVDEELRREQLTTTWKRYGKWIVAAVVLFLIGLAAFLYWRQQQEIEAGKQGEQLTALFEEIQQGKTKGIDAKLDAIAKEGGPGYRAAALLTKADVAVTQGNDAGAVAAFRQVAEDEAVAAPWRELALIRQTAAEYDKIPPATVIQRLQPLAVAGNPWFGSAGELVAVAHLRAKRPQQAAAMFAAMAKDEGLPESIRSRALQMAGALGVDAVQQGATKESTQ